MNPSKVFATSSFGYLICVGFVAGALVLSTSVQAEEGEKDWEWNLAPLYLWAVNITGDLRLGPVSAPVDVKFEDLFDNLDAVFTVHFEGAHKSGWGFLIDYIYADIGGSTSMSLPAPIGPVTQEVDFKMKLAELVGFYRFSEPARKSKLDVLFGVRYTEFDPTVKLSNSRGGPLELNPKQDWTDPFVGGRWSWQFADEWQLVLRGDIGGFGAGSDFTWQAVGLLDWQPFRHASFSGGYGALSQDYSDNGGSRVFKYDATMHGPVLALNIRW